MFEKKDPLDLDVRLLNMTCIVSAKCGSRLYTGTAFFYSQLENGFTGPINEEKQIGWKKVEHICLVTNRHVVFPHIKGEQDQQKELIPDTFTFFLRKLVKNQIEWFPVAITKDDLVKRTRFHSNAGVDLACIDVYDLVFDARVKDNSILNIGHLTNYDLPANQPLKIETTSDIIVCSYPKGFYDNVNKFPIIKSGIIASGWGIDFNGRPTFLIDSKLFPGSSGGLVLSKPVDVAMINGQLMKNEHKQFVFLGVYSGEYSFQEKKEDGTLHNEYYGLGNVWYSYLIPEIVNNGVKYI